MQLKCSHCPFIATSMIIGNDNAALSELSNIFATHINKVHPDKATQLVKDHMHLAKVAMWLMTITKNSTYLDDMENRTPEEAIRMNDPLEEAFDNQVEVLEELVGIEMFGNRPSGNDDDDDIELVGDGLATPPPGALPL